MYELVREWKNLYAVSIIAILLPFAVRAGELHIYEHNGSVVDLFMVNDRVTVTYSVPRPGLQAAGIREGTTIFKGTFDGERFEGNAFVFKAGCHPAAYRVLGRAEGRDKIVLRGPAPIRAKEGCAITGYSAASPHARLVFTYSATHH